MSKTLKKTLSIILAIVMVVTTIPFAFAADEIPPTRVIDGETYYELDSAEDYLWFVQMCNDSVNPDEPDYEHEDDWYHQTQKDYYIPYNAILTDDIVINSNVIVDGELTEDTASLIEVDPIAKYYEEPETYSYNISYYTGTFDGNGYSVSGLYMCNTDREYAMFRNVHNDGVIKNLHIKDSYFTGDWSIAALVGSNKGTISGCSFDGIVYTSYYAGGLVSGNSGLIENSYNAGHIHSSGHQNAGIAIHNNGTIRNCYNIGTIGNTTGAFQTGGITGSNRGSMENCYNIGEILGDNDVAAISPYNQNEATITNCYFNSDAFSGRAVNTNYNESGITNVEGKTAAEFADAVVCLLVGFHSFENGNCILCGVGTDHEHTTETQTCAGYRCKYCGIYHGETAPDNHSYGDYEVVIEPGCESEGLEKAFCIHCGVDALERSIAETGHSWQNKDGVCDNNCGTVCEHPEDKLEWKEIIAAEQCKPGQQKANCTYCGYEGFIKSLCDKEEYPESLHDYASNSNETWDFSSEGAKKLLLVFSEKTFTEKNWDYIYLYDGNGTEIGKYTDNQLAGAGIEIEGDSFSVKLTSDGSVNKYGFSFDAIYSMDNDPDLIREIPAPHNIVNVEAQAPTCTEIGWDAYEYCTECDYSTYEEIPASHEIKTVDKKDATCTQAGHEAYEYCTVCDYTTYVEIPVVYHIDNDGDYECDYGCGTQISDGGEGGTGEPETPDEPTEDTCDRCGEVHTDFFRNFICMIKDFFNRIISFLTSLFK